MSTYSRSFKPAAGELGEGYARRPNMGNIYVGIVKDNNDAQRMGRIMVWIPELGGDQNDRNNWIVCSYVTPFAGATPLTSNVRDGTEAAQSQQSYGFIAQPPHIGNEVVVGFLNGSPNRGIYFGCLFQQFMNHNTPGMASSTLPGENVQGPSVEYNRYTTTPNLNVNSATRPIFTPLAQAIVNQGLQGDSVRGNTDASMRRDSPSNIYGLLSPRGHQLYIDDGRLTEPVNDGSALATATRLNVERRRDESSPEYIRLRTRNGTQVLINDTEGYVYIISGNGNSWFQISDTGGISGYSSVDISLRSQKNINLHADGNMNLYSANGLNVFSGGRVGIGSNDSIQLRTNGALNLQSDAQLSIKAGKIVAIDGQAVKIKENLAVDASVAQPFLMPDRSIDNGISYPRTETQTLSLTLPSHEPYDPGAIRRSNDPETPNAQSSEINPGIPANTDPNLGSCARYFESRNDPGIIGRDRTGGWSYGLAQFAANVGGMNTFMAAARERSPVIFERLQAAGGNDAARRGDEVFQAEWRRLARDPETKQEFTQIQIDIAKEKWYQPGLRNVNRALNTDFSKRGPGVQELIYSSAVQHGENGIVTVFRNALRGRNIDTMSDEEIIRAVQSERGRRDSAGNSIYFASSTPAVQNSVLNNRYPAELNCFLSKNNQAVASRTANNSSNTA
jgi:hypothetical protein